MKYYIDLRVNLGVESMRRIIIRCVGGTDTHGGVE